MRSCSCAHLADFGIAWRVRRRVVRRGLRDCRARRGCRGRPLRVNCRTTAPRPGDSSSRPSLARNLSASRSGVRETPSILPRLPSWSRVPGASSPSMIMSRTRATMASWRRRADDRAARIEVADRQVCSLKCHDSFHCFSPPVPDGRRILIQPFPESMQTKFCIQHTCVRNSGLLVSLRHLENEAAVNAHTSSTTSEKPTSRVRDGRSRRHQP